MHDYIENFEATILKAATLIEALPYLQQFRGKTFLIKLGGSVMENEVKMQALMQDLVFLEVAGINPILVHGGGKAISAQMLAEGIEAKFEQGYRVTCDKSIKIVDQVLRQELSPQLAGWIEEKGGRATCIQGQKVFIGEPKQLMGADKQPVDLGRVGNVTQVNIDEVRAIIAQERIPVVTPLACDQNHELPLNINADLAAAALAQALQVTKLIYLSDVPGVLEDVTDKSSLIHSINETQAQDLIERGVVSGGMLPKINSALETLKSGVDKIHFIDALMPHSLLLEIFTKEGIGTQITH